MVLSAFPPGTLLFPKIPDSMFWSPYGGPTDLWPPEAILSDPKDACSHASFGFELSAQNYFLPSRVERYFLARSLTAPRQKRFDSTWDKVKMENSLLGTVALLLDFRALSLCRHGSRNRWWRVLSLLFLVGQTFRTNLHPLTPPSGFTVARGLLCGRNRSYGGEKKSSNSSYRFKAQPNAA